MIFQSTIDQIDAEISQLLAALEAKKQRQSQLLELDSLTDHTLEGLAAVVSKTAHYAPNAIASLRIAAHDQVNLFTTDEFLQFQHWDKDQLDELWDGEWVSDYGCQYRWGGATINRWIVVFADSCEWASPFTSPIACLLWVDAPLLG